ncbi:MAG: hypothetical protein IPM37_21105 [Hahellaceae bacterium]|nr:hypothetical protein [Hahellaceae bacterium]
MGSSRIAWPLQAETTLMPEVRGDQKLSDHNQGKIPFQGVFNLVEV